MLELFRKSWWRISALLAAVVGLGLYLDAMTPRLVRAGISPGQVLIKAIGYGAAFSLLGAVVGGMKLWRLGGSRSRRAANVFVGILWGVTTFGTIGVLFGATSSVFGLVSLMVLVAAYALGAHFGLAADDPGNVRPSNLYRPAEVQETVVGEQRPSTDLGGGGRSLAMLSGMQRVGVVLSCLWISVVGMRTAYERFGPFESCEHTQLTYLLNPEVKESSPSGSFDPSTAVPVNATQCPPIGMRRQIRSARATVLGVLPVLAMWVLLPVGLVAIRWIRRGFHGDAGTA